MDVMLVAACGLVWLLHLVQLWRAGRHAWHGALLIALLGLTITVAAQLFWVERASSVAITAVTVLLVLPALATRSASSAIKWGHIGRARVLARLAATLRPIDAQRQFRRAVEISWQLNRGEPVDLEAALDSLGSPTPSERDAHALAFLSWTNDFAAMQERLKRPGVEGVALRAGLNGIATTIIGETEDIDALLRWYQRLVRSGALERRQLDASWTLLVVAGYLGDVQLLRQHLPDVQGDVPPARVAFVLATAQQRAGGPHDAAGTALAALRMPLLDSTARRLRYRLAHPLAPLPQRDDVQAVRADIAERLRTRRALAALSLKWRKPSPLTWTISGTLAAVFAWQLAQPSQRLSFARWGLQAPFADAPDMYRLLSYAWLHLDITHFGVNVLGLLFFGRFVERNFGPWRTAVIYLLGALGGGAAYLAFESSRSVAIGASGAVMALFGATVVRVASDRALRRSRQGRRELIFLATIAIVQLAVDSLWALSAGSAHAGGLATGALLGWLLSRRPTRLT